MSLLRGLRRISHPVREGCKGLTQLRAAGGRPPLTYRRSSIAFPGRQVQLGNVSAAHKASGVNVGPEDVPRDSCDTSIVTHNSRQRDLAQGPPLSLGENTPFLPPEPSKTVKRCGYRLGRNSHIMSTRYFTYIISFNCPKFLRNRYYSCFVNEETGSVVKTIAQY